MILLDDHRPSEHTDPTALYAAEQSTTTIGAYR